MPPRPNLLTQEINLGPLVDLVLVLLILLVVVIPMLRPSSLPEAQAPVRTLAPGRPVPVQAPVLVDHLAVAIGADGAVFIEQRRVAREELAELLVALHDAGPNRPVLVKGDRHLRYRQVRQVMADLYRAGFQRVALTLDASPPAS